jgi:hypothetical protein
MASQISNTDDVIYSRDVIARIEELCDERASLVLALADWDEENGEELKALEALQEEAEGSCPDWRYGVALVRDSYFEDYARDFADDIGAVNKNASWPNDCIDWDRAARLLQMDYTSVEFDGVTYWVR